MVWFCLVQHMALPPIKTWPSQNGWSFSCWLRLDPVTGTNVEREKPYIYRYIHSITFYFYCHSLKGLLEIVHQKPYYVWGVFVLT